MSSENNISDIERDRQLLVEAKQKGKLSTLRAWVRLSGPGWLQSAITIGGGSLSNSLYLGVLVGFSCMWIQPMAMILGVVMLSAISYVALSTGQRPFRAINEHVSPVLGWGWILASMVANVVWALPQYSLSAGALQQNLFPDFFGTVSTPGVFGSAEAGTAVAALMVLGVAIFNVMLYIRGGWGVKVFEIIIKTVIGLIVIAFFGVIIKLSCTEGSRLEWNRVFAGLVPDIDLFNNPAPAIAAEIGNVSEGFRGFWTDHVVGAQRSVMIGAAATAVGINMTFLLPYSMIRKGWGREFKHLAIFDLATGLVIPFTLATGCVVMATATQFHARPFPGLLGEKDANGNVVPPDENLVEPYKKLLDKRITGSMKAEQSQAYKDLDDSEKQNRRDALPLADRRVAAMLVSPDSFNLARSLKPLLGEGLAMYIFGFGVVAMTLNAATMLMLINGLCLCELLGKPLRGKTQVVGSLLPAVGVTGAFFWSGAKMWLAVPTSVFCSALLPVAYIAFAVLINQNKLMGEDRLRGPWKLIWNAAMALAVVATTGLSLWVLWSKAGWPGIGIFVAFGLLVIVVHFARKGRTGAWRNT